MVVAGLDTSEGRAFVRDRVATFGKTIFVLSGGFWAILSGVYAALGKTPDAIIGGWRASAFHFSAASIMGILWWVARRRDWKLRELAMLDGGALLVCNWCWAGMIAPQPTSPFVALLASMATVNAHAVLVPSSARRTLILSSLAMAPIFVCSVIFATGPRITPPIAALSAALWIGVAVACATIASRVIYGLRQRVKEATELGQYTLEEQIGSGGMGEVWRARHRLLIRPAAIKLIRPHAQGSERGSDPEVLLRRFEREARATAALRSPHIVQLYDFGVTDDGTLYYVMELLEGFNLEQLVQRYGSLPPERVVFILEQLCSALSDAHHNGLVHRDIKPANVFVSRVGLACDFVKVLDFGLVKLDRPRDPEDATRLTAVGVATGTPAFMAPEMVVGDSAADHRVDIYSLGCVAYWMLTGHLVFEGTTAMKVMLDHARTPAPSPSARSELPMPRALERLVLDCLAKEPSDRPATAEEVAARLAACEMPVRWTQERAARWWVTHAPGLADPRPAAEMLLSQEGHHAGPRLDP